MNRVVPHIRKRLSQRTTQSIHLNKQWPKLPPLMPGRMLVLPSESSMREIRRLPGKDYFQNYFIQRVPLVSGSFAHFLFNHGYHCVRTGEPEHVWIHQNYLFRKLLQLRCRITIISTKLQVGVLRYCNYVGFWDRFLI